MLKYLKEKIFDVKRLTPILILIILIFLGGCKKKELIQPLTDSQKEAFNYLPEESGFVMFLDLNEIRKTDFWDSYFRGALLEDNSSSNIWLKKFETETGIGLNKGIAQIFISTSKNFKHVAVIALNKNSGNIRINFNSNSDFKKEIIGNKPVYKLKGKIPLQLYFVNDSMLLAADDLNYIENVIKGKNGSLNSNKEFIGTIKSIKNKNQYWAASDRGEHMIDYIKRFFNFQKNIPANNIFKSIVTVTLSARFDNGVDIESNLNCSDSRNAYLLSTAIKGALAMDLLSGGDYSFGKILQKTEVERLNSEINLQLELKGNDINTLKDFAKQRNLARKL